MNLKKSSSLTSNGKGSGATPPVGKLTFFFERGSARVRASELPKLTALARMLRRNPDALLMIRGFTVGRGSDDYNKRLGARRARAVATALMQMGIDSRRIVSASSAGKRPFDQLQPIDRRRRRRAEANLMQGAALALRAPPLLAQVWLREQRGATAAA